jgi:hypothetical protein
MALAAIFTSSHSKYAPVIQLLFFLSKACCLQHICAVNVCLSTHTCFVHGCCTHLLNTAAVYGVFTAEHILVVYAIYTCCFTVVMLCICCMHYLVVLLFFLYILWHIYIHICCAHLVYIEFALLICIYDMHM